MEKTTTKSKTTKTELQKTKSSTKKNDPSSRAVSEATAEAYLSSLETPLYDLLSQRIAGSGLHSWIYDALTTLDRKEEECIDLVLFCDGVYRRKEIVR